jgi:hypothetical protein
MTRILIAAVALATLAPVAAQQRPARDVAPPRAAAAGTIAGLVSVDPTGDALRGVEVRVTSEATSRSRGRVTYTDRAGRYRIDNLPPGAYTVTAAKTGYVTRAHGQRRAFDPGEPVMVNAGEDVPGIDFTLARGAVIVVRLTDEFGEPLAGVGVVAHRLQPIDGEPRLVPVTEDRWYSTDDRGEIRLADLPAGDYFVSTWPGVLPRTETPVIYYPGTTERSEAEPIAVGQGQETAIALTVARP